MQKKDKGHAEKRALHKYKPTLPHFTPIIANNPKLWPIPDSLLHKEKYEHSIYYLWNDNRLPLSDTGLPGYLERRAGKYTEILDL